MDTLFGWLFEGLAALLMGIVGLIARFLAWIFGESFAATPHVNLGRLSSFAAFLLGIYLLVGLLRGYVPELAGPGIGTLYGFWAMAVGFVLFVLFLILPFALDIVEVADDLRGRRRRTGWLTGLVFPALLLGGFALWSQATRVPTMEERFCDGIVDRMGDRTQKAANWLDRWVSDVRGKETGFVTECLQRSGANPAG